VLLLGLLHMALSQGRTGEILALLAPLAKQIGPHRTLRREILCRPTSGLMEPENLFRLLEEYKIEATLMRVQSAATKLRTSRRAHHMIGGLACA